MFSKKTDIGFHLVVSATVDPEIGEQVQLSTNAPTGATADELHRLIKTMSLACWMQRVVVNERKQELNDTVAKCTEEQVAAKRASGEEVDEELIADHRRFLTTQQLKSNAQVDADRAVLARLVGNGGAACGDSSQ